MQKKIRSLSGKTYRMETQACRKPGSVVGSYLSRRYVAITLERSAINPHLRMQEFLPRASCCG